MASVYDFSARDIDGNERSLERSARYDAESLQPAIARQPLDFGRHWYGARPRFGPLPRPVETHDLVPALDPDIGDTVGNAEAFGIVEPGAGQGTSRSAENRRHLAAVQRDWPAIL